MVMLPFWAIGGQPAGKCPGNLAGNINRNRVIEMK